MGPSWVLPAPDGPHVGLMNIAVRVGRAQHYDMVNVVQSTPGFFQNSRNIYSLLYIHPFSAVYTSVQIDMNWLIKQIPLQKFRILFYSFGPDDITTEISWNVIEAGVKCEHIKAEIKMADILQGTISNLFSFKMSVGLLDHKIHC